MNGLYDVYITYINKAITKKETRRGGGKYAVLKIK